jgi:peroxisomal membrane protein 4
MDSRLAAINTFINNPKYADYLAIVKGARNGFVYGPSPESLDTIRQVLTYKLNTGVKIRFPHAVVMAILFGRGE